ncbi:2'-5' RNA ligase family protein [Thermoproteus tenax]|uniref:2'-5' RNA ligase family protein n=1 Tax=Thermoproteus tenax TaxID=2271 RepID=UPI00069BFB8B|nr:2'-5' RNA ligase family protein [Thermoproteus tenax]
MPYIYAVLLPFPPLRPLEGFRPVKPHITLLKLRRPIETTVSARRFLATLGEVVILPSRSKPRFIALEAKPYSDFLSLRRALEVAVGGSLEERYIEFRPHATLYSVRLKRPSEDELEPALREAASLRGFSFEVREVHLVDTTGGEYKSLRSIKLA